MIFILIAFIILLFLGVRLGELSWRSVLIYLLLMVLAWVICFWFAVNPAFLFAFIALLDIVLILVIFKGDVRLR